jgi:hypothetical protein
MTTSSGGLPVFCRLLTLTVKSSIKRLERGHMLSDEVHLTSHPLLLRKAVRPNRIDHCKTGPECTL